MTPLEFMLNIMRTEPSEMLEPRELLAAQTLRFEAAKAAAPYVHPRLAAVEHSGPNGGPIQQDHALDASNMPTEVLAAIMQARDAAVRS